MQFPQLFSLCCFSCLITTLLGLYIPSFITLIQISLRGEVAAGNQGLEMRFRTLSLSFLSLKGRALLEVHKQMFGFFLPFPQHLHHPAKIKLVFFCSSFPKNTVQHFEGLLKESCRWAYSLSFGTIQRALLTF